MSIDDDFRSIRMRLWRLYGAHSAIDEWLKAPHQLLGDRRAYDLIMQGKASEVLTVLDALESGAYT